MEMYGGISAHVLQQLELDRRAAEAQPSDIDRPNPVSQVFNHRIQRASPRGSSSPILAPALGVAARQPPDDSHEVAFSSASESHRSDSHHRRGDESGLGLLEIGGDSQEDIIAVMQRLQEEIILLSPSVLGFTIMEIRLPPLSHPVLVLPDVTTQPPYGTCHSPSESHRTSPSTPVPHRTSPCFCDSPI